MVATTSFPAEKLFVVLVSRNCIVIVSRVPVVGGIVVGQVQTLDLLTFLWVDYDHGNSGHAPPRVSSAIAISASGVWNP